jgi:hypothetical protein
MKIIPAILFPILFSLQLTAGVNEKPETRDDTLYPPCNFQAEVFNFYFVVFLQWEAPGSCEPDSMPVEPAAFRIYRDEVMVAEVAGDDFLFIDGNGSYLQPGGYSYTITALYESGNDLLESEPAGPVQVVIEPIILYANGMVWNCELNETIAGATVTIGEYSATTQSNGTYTMILILPFDSLTAYLTAPDYCDTSFVVNGDWYNPILSFCMRPCGVLGNSSVSVDKSFDIFIFPVPASDFLNVQMDDGIRLIRLINYNGEIVFETQNYGEQSCQMDVKHFPASIYTLQVVTNNGRILNRKVAINR